MRRWISEKDGKVEDGWFKCCTGVGAEGESHGRKYFQNYRQKKRS